MNKMTYVLWNDRLVKEGETVISPEDRGYQFGDGIYEVVKVYNGQLFTAKEHIDRFYASADKIRLVIPYTKDVLHKMIYDLIEANELQTGHVYFQITRGATPRNHPFPGSDVPTVFTANTKVNPRPLQNFENGVKTTVTDDIRWLRNDIKSLNLLGAVLAKQFAVEKGCYEAILHRDGTVTEGSSSNILAIKDGVLYTHPANNLILKGITREVVIQCAKEIGLPVVEEAFTTEALLQMDELIVTSTTSEVTPIIDVDGQVIGNGKPGEWTRKLQVAFDAKIPQSINA